MRVWAVYEGTRGRYVARPFDGARAGFLTLAGGDTEAASRDRAQRLADVYNREADEERAAQRAERAARRGS